MLSKNAAKYIQSLQHKKFRDEDGVFVAEGPKLVNELLNQAVFECKALYVAENAENFITSAHIETTIEIVKDFELQKISSLSTANQVLGIFNKRAQCEEPNLANKITLALDDIQDPGNLGTIIRIADWYGIENIICSHNTADMYNPKVVQSTMASIGRVNVIYAELEPFLKNTPQLKYAAVLKGSMVHQLPKVEEAILIIGNEARGISEPVLALANKKITIQKFGLAESLNAAVATAVILQELVVKRQV